MRTQVGQFPQLNPLGPEHAAATMKEMGQTPTSTAPIFSFLQSVPDKVADKAVAAKDWFRDPAWIAGPPLWQVGLAGAGITAAVGVVLYGFLKK